MLTQRKSPRWLVEKQRTDEVRRVLAHVRARPVDDAAIRLELDEIIADFHGRERLSVGRQLGAI